MDLDGLPVFAGTLRRTVDERKEVICVLNGDLRIIHCNPAWDRFALDNAGEHAIASEVLGSSLLNAVGAPLKDFYRRLFELVASSGKPFSFDYECSTADRSRMFRMEVMPLHPDGFLIVHSLRVEQPHSRKTEPADRQPYEASGGLIVMCSHCRRTRRAEESQTWDWVPAFLTDHSLNISHGLCQLCRLYYYSMIPTSDSAPT